MSIKYYQNKVFIKGNTPDKSGKDLNTVPYSWLSSHAMYFSIDTASTAIGMKPCHQYLC